MAIFAYQSYWLYNLYVTQKQEMETAVKEAMRISDYNELVLRITRLSNDKNARHGEVSFQTGYTLDKDNRLVNQGMQTKVTTNDTDAIVIHQGGWRDSLTIKRTKQGQNRNLSINVNSRHTGVVADSKDALFVGMVEKKQSENDLVRMMQQGIHSGIDMLSEPDIRVFDSLLTARLTDRHIDSRHRLEQLHVVPQAMDSARTDTLATVNTPDYLPSDESLVFDYTYDMYNNQLYRLYIEPFSGSVLRQMTGILASSAATFLVLAFVFWYLIRTLLRQRSYEEMKDDFTHNITHELKTPVSVAYAANDALLQFADDLDRETRENYLKMSLEQLRKLGGMIEQILSTSMKRRKTFVLHKETLDVRHALAGIVEEQRLRAKKPTDITLDVVPDDLTVSADRQHFTQIVSNILDNAIKYSREQVQIAITCTKDTDGNVVIQISDNGIGISKSHQQHIFDKFYRVPNGNLHEVKGYGLGLYYVATMMRLHGGTVDVVSEQGRGTTFKLLFR
ncbi:MAG: HAMP domain-containing sensor histidine kinase [bacterium]|nr:HAMP domain-containing sensor histidine kinase [bacterium]